MRTFETRPAEAYGAFERRCESIMSLIRCADVTALHALAILRSQEPNVALIKNILTEQGVSQLAHSWQWFMSGEERQKFGENAYIQAACEHIVFASFVAIESYLIAKFAEYFYNPRTQNPGSKYRVFSELRFRNLTEIARHYKDFCNLQVPRFNHPDITIYDEANWFQPNSCWGGLKYLEKCRNDVAHEGAMKPGKVITLVE